MGAFKQFNSQDIIISPFEVNKSFHFVGGDALTGSDVGIDRYQGRTGNYLISGSDLTGNIPGQQIPKVLVYDSVKQLYYGNYVSSSAGFVQNSATASLNTDGTYAGSKPFNNFDNFSQTTLWPNRDFPTSSLNPIGVISIPSKLFGDYIQPESFLLEHSESGSIKDDGQGRLLYKTKNESDEGYEHMAGNIIYEHGIITLFDSVVEGSPLGVTYGTATYGTDIYGGSTIPTELFIEAFITSSEVTMSFSSSYEIHETQYKCTLTEDEYNYSQNPTVLSGSEGFVHGYASSSYFDPYVTTIGLYNNSFDLVAVGKLAKPLPTSRTTDTTILVNIDR